VSLVWHELASPAAKGVGWLLALGASLAAAVVSRRVLAANARQNTREIPAGGDEDLYPAAVNEYLKRNFVAAERLAQKLLARNDRDVPAILMLASVWRRTGRTSEAKADQVGRGPALGFGDRTRAVAIGKVGEGSNGSSAARGEFG
jgi:hypothetical protein